MAGSNGEPIGSFSYAAATRSTTASTTEECAITRRMLVHRWPAVPAAEKTMPRVVRSRSAEGPTIAALLPPSSSSDRPNRAATRGPTSRPIRVDPVADSRATAGSSTSASPTGASPSTT